MKHCEIHGDYEPEILTREAIRSPVDGMVLVPAARIETGCPGCIADDEAKLAARKAAEEARQEREREDAREAARLRHFAEMNIEPAFYDASFDAFETPTAELEHNLGRVRDLIAGRILKIVMTGRNGTGKTHLACAALHILGGRIMSMYEISATIRESYTARGLRSELSIVDELARLPLLVIDEIGRTKGGDADANWLSYIIDKRHTRGLPLILISNKHTRKECAKGGCADCLENYIGEDIMSRLCEGGVSLKFTGADWRKRNARAVA